MATFEINGTDYASKPMDAFVLIKIMKRLSRIAPALKAMAEGGVDALGEIEMYPIFNAVADMPDDDLDYIINACCSVTDRRAAKGVGWLGVIQNGIYQDKNDKEPTVLLLIAWNVLRENFVSFFDVAKRVRAEL